jgi:hypothetical protein
MVRPVLIACLVPLVIGACTWVKMEPVAYEVRVAREGEDLSFCERRGELTVSVRDRVALYPRNELKVRDELETLARNEVPRMQADTIQPISQPVRGEQRFAAYACRGATRDAAPVAPVSVPREPGEAQTFPLRDD